MNNLVRISITWGALIAGINICTGDISKKPPRQPRQPPAMVFALEWRTPGLNLLCPSNSIVRNLSTNNCVLEWPDGSGSLSLSPNETIFTTGELRFQKVPNGIEMATIPFDSVSAALEKIKGLKK